MRTIKTVAATILATGIAVANGLDSEFFVNGPKSGIFDHSLEGGNTLIRQTCKYLRRDLLCEIELYSSTDLMAIHNNTDSLHEERNSKAATFRFLEDLRKVEVDPGRARFISSGWDQEEIAFTSGKPGFPDAPKGSKRLFREKRKDTPFIKDHYATEDAHLTLIEMAVKESGIDAYRGKLRPLDDVYHIAEIQGGISQTNCSLIPDEKVDLPIFSINVKSARSMICLTRKFDANNMVGTITFYVLGKNEVLLSPSFEYRRGNGEMPRGQISPGRDNDHIREVYGFIQNGSHFMLK